MTENFDKAFCNFACNVREAEQLSAFDNDVNEAHDSFIKAVRKRLADYNLELDERPDRKFVCTYESETDVIYFIMEWA